MKRTLTTSIFLCLSYMNVMTARPITLPYSVPEERVNAFSEANDDWVLLGEVTLSNCHPGNESIIAKLHVREIAKKLIYRVEYQGEFYASTWHDESSTYHVTINGQTYRCDVPANSTTNETDREKSAKFVGKWMIIDPDWYVDISFHDDRYCFRFNPNIAIVSRQEIANGIEFTYVENKDHSLELDEDEYYYTEGNKCADPGYQPYGKYKHDKEVEFTTKSITFSDKAPILKTIKTHTYYYWREKVIYAETDTAYSDPIFSCELIRY